MASARRSIRPHRRQQEDDLVVTTAVSAGRTLRNALAPFTSAARQLGPPDCLVAGVVDRPRAQTARGADADAAGGVAVDDVLVVAAHGIGAADRRRSTGPECRAEALRPGWLPARAGR